MTEVQRIGGQVVTWLASIWWRSTTEIIQLVPIIRTKSFGKKILKKTGKRSRIIWYRQYFERNIYTNWKISRLFTLKVQSNISIWQTETNWQISGQSQHKSAQINRVINSTQTFIGDAIKTNSTNILRWPFHSFHSDSIRTHFFFPNISVAMAIGYFRLIKLKQPDSNSIPISCPSTEKKTTHTQQSLFIHSQHSSKRFTQLTTSSPTGGTLYPHSFK